MGVTRHETKPDWPKMGPSVLIATALIVAIRTAKWAARPVEDPLFEDVDTELDKEVNYAAKISIRVMNELLDKHAALFPSVRVPVYEATDDEVPK